MTKEKNTPKNIIIFQVEDYATEKTSIMNDGEV